LTFEDVRVLTKKIITLSLIFTLIFIISCQEEDIPHLWRVMDESIFNNFNDIYAFDFRSVWMCGDNGVIAKFNSLDDPGERIQYQDSKTDNTLNSIDFYNQSFGFSVGEFGTIVRYETNWQSEISPTSKNLYSVSVIDDEKAWAVGEDGVILIYQYNEDTEEYVWEEYYQENLDITSDLLDIDMSNDSYGLICGEDGVILEWDGSNWSEFQSSVSTKLNSVKVVSAQQSFVVGNYGTIIEYDGQSWNDISIGGTVNLTDIDMKNNEGWIISSSGEIFYFDGVSINQQDFITDNHLTSVHIASRYDAWICGYQGVIIRYY
jgi:hypothetical protein